MTLLFFVSGRAEELFVGGVLQPLVAVLWDVHDEARAAVCMAFAFDAAFDGLRAAILAAGAVEPLRALVARSHESELTGEVAAQAANALRKIVGD